MDTFIANLAHAIRNRETVSIGGGTFSADELRAVNHALAKAHAQELVLREIEAVLAQHPDADKGNTKVHYCLCRVRGALQAQ